MSIVCVRVCRLLQNHHGVQSRSDCSVVCRLFHRPLPAHRRKSSPYRRYSVGTQKRLPAPKYKYKSIILAFPVIWRCVLSVCCFQNGFFEDAFVCRHVLMLKETAQIGSFDHYKYTFLHCNLLLHCCLVKQQNVLIYTYTYMYINTYLRS